MDKLIAENKRLAEKIESLELQLARQESTFNDFNKHISSLLLKNKNLTAMLRIEKSKSKTCK